MLLYRDDEGRKLREAAMNVKKDADNVRKTVALSECKADERTEQ